MPLDELLKLLGSTQLETMQYFELSEPDLSKSYAVDKWTIKEILHHLADAEMVLSERIKRTIANPNQSILAFNQDAWADKLTYTSMPLSLSKNKFRATREASIYLCASFYVSHGQNTYLHSETGSRTIKDEFIKVALHNQGHLVQIKKALNHV